MKGSNAPNLHRIAYHEGQLLTARDLRDDAAYESRLRGLHVRGQHNTWGVALGFAVSRRDDRFVQVGPGMAYDALGREILSARTFTVGMPVVPKTDAAGFWFDLVIGYRHLSELPDAACSNGEERPAWRWCLAGEAAPGAAAPGLSRDVRLGEDIPLVRCLVTAGARLGEALDFSFRREAQGMVRPHIASGHLLATVTFDEAQRAFTTVVNTSAGGFSQQPAYFARVSIPSLTGPEVETSGPLGPFVSIRNPGRTSFALDVRTAVSGPGPIGIVGIASAVGRLQAQVEVDWMGIEPTGGCAPALDLSSFFFLFATPFAFPQAVLSPGLSTGGTNG